MSEMAISTAAPSSLSEAVNAEHAQQAALHGFGGVVDQVGQGAADGFGIGQNRGQARLEVPLHGDAIETAGKQRQRFLGNAFRSQARGCGAGNCASAENWSTSVRNVPTQPRITSLHLRMTLGESGWPRSRWRPMRSAESAMGVSGFLISWATRCATSFQANWRCARNSSVVSSTTSTVPGCPCARSRRALVTAR